MVNKMSVQIVFFLVGVGLVILGGVAGVALFLRALGSKEEKSSWGVSTLRGLFILCLVGGLIILGSLAGIR